MVVGFSGVEDLNRISKEISQASSMLVIAMAGRSRKPRELMLEVSKESGISYSRVHLAFLGALNAGTIKMDNNYILSLGERLTVKQTRHLGKKIAQELVPLQGLVRDLGSA